ncbi:nuclear transport factor 2 family protein [Actinomadura viridis]|uniref:Mce-associated membrane protein n=1 Tax=Actinomadura viridis TaxID=58110 RepID=A0A931DKW9_9ACTN|nr:hypothetical protein [Actinomadura viridis]MBG6091357.1 Mce-associated membrane protein [Actinomadura viridis]
MSTQADTETRDDAPAGAAPDEDRPARRGRAGIWRPLAVALVLALAAVGVLAFTEQRRDTSPAANRALVDAQATTKAVGDVSNALVKIFSYEHGDVAATERAAAGLLEGKAAEQYRSLFAQVKSQAPAQRLSLTTRVVRAGVSRMSGGTAHLLVFLDQVSTRAGRPAGGTAAAQLAVTAHLRGGQWRIAEIRSS